MATTGNYITLTELREELQEALKPVHDRLDLIEGGVKSVQEDVQWLKGHVQDLQTDMADVKTKMAI